MPYDNKDPKRDHNFDNHPYAEKGMYGKGKKIWLVMRCSLSTAEAAAAVAGTWISRSPKPEVF